MPSFFPPEDHKNHFILETVPLPLCVSALNIVYRCKNRQSFPLSVLEVNFLLVSLQKMNRGKADKELVSGTVYRSSVRLITR